MALDRTAYEPDGIGADRIDQRESGAEATVGRVESGGAGGATDPAEVRTRAEYYAACTEGDRAIPADEDHRQEDRRTTAADEDHRQEGGRPERSGWDAVDAGNRPALDALRMTPERRTHILDGDAYGGGHRHGTGRPGKTEFPASWDDEKIVGNILDAAQRPDSPPVYQHWNDRWLGAGTRDGVEVSVIVLPSGEVWTAWPEQGGPGVVRNPRRGTS
jgi:Bacterial EndoU nuclease